MLEALQWLTYGVSAIDAEHERLLKFIKVVEGAHASRCDSMISKQFLDNMVKFTKSHCSNEEDLMFAIGYPKVNEQLLAHSELFDRLTEISENYTAATNAHKTLLEIATLHKNHFREHDVKLATFIRRSASKANREHAVA